MPVGVYKRTEEGRRNMSVAQKGRKRGPQSEEHKRKISETKRGENNPAWVGGTVEYWAKELKKINKECVLCKSNVKLEMHHKDENHNNDERSNLIILCRLCHRFWHWGFIKEILCI